MKKEFNVIIEKDEEGYYVATVPALKGCHTQAKSLDELMERTKEAIELCLEEEKDITYPFDFVGVQKITVKEKSVKYSGRQSLKKKK
jgi:predicted RNase H-like HicB family nuclease